MFNVDGLPERIEYTTRHSFLILFFSFQVDGDPRGIQRSTKQVQVTLSQFCLFRGIFEIRVNVAGNCSRKDEGTGG